jgi:hypothetical protein
MLLVAKVYITIERQHEGKLRALFTGVAKIRERRCL